MATGQLPEAKIHDIYFESDPFPSWRIGQKIRLHFIHTPQRGEIIVFPLVRLSEVAGKKVNVHKEHICWHSRDLLEISVITIYIYIGTSHPFSPSPLSILFYCSVYLSCTPRRFPVKCNPEKRICHNRWSGKWIRIQPQTVKWKYILLLPTTKSRFMQRDAAVRYNNWYFQTRFFSLWSHLRPYCQFVCMNVCVHARSRPCLSPFSHTTHCVYYFSPRTNHIPLPYWGLFHFDDSSKEQLWGPGIWKIG